jgi:hypothetical protein
MTISIEPKRILTFTLRMIAVLVVCDLVVVTLKHVFGFEQIFGLQRQFDLDNEANIPAYLSALQLAFAALVLAAIARGKLLARDAFARHWAGLAIIFAVLSLDEAASFHEMLVTPLRAALPLTGAWHGAWYIVYGLLLGAFARHYWRFFWTLPALVRMRFAFAGATYLTGCIGFEMIASRFAWYSSLTVAGTNYRVALLQAFEEPLEMLGIALFVYSALSYAAASGVAILEVRIAAEPTAAIAASKRAPPSGAGPLPLPPPASPRPRLPA